MLHQKFVAGCDVDLLTIVDIYERADVEFVPTPPTNEAAAHEIPAAVGWMIVGAYAGIMSLFILTFARSAEPAMVTVISALYALIYLAVPAIFLRVEGRSGHTTLPGFLNSGLQTNTGHVTGREAIVQIMTIPLAIAVAVGGICVIVAFSR